MAATPYGFPKTQHDILIELADRTTRVLRFGESLEGAAEAALNARPATNRWSALECFEHLNRYAAHYLPQLEAKAAAAPPRRTERYRPSLLGKPFALALHPDNRKTLSSPRDMNAHGSALNARVVVRDFVAYQRRYAAVLDGLKGKSLRGSRIPLSLSRLIRFHLGDILTTLVWHNERHAHQASVASGLPMPEVAASARPAMA